MSQDASDNSTSVRHLFEVKEWNQTPLGPRSQWPESLKTAVGIMLDSQFPMFIAWGSERIFLYNDAYTPILGNKHPLALGMKFEVLWSEIWDDLLPLIQSVDAGKPVYLEDMRLIMHRHGYDEETFFTFSYSPIMDEFNHVQGLFCACVETTKRKQFEDALKISQESLIDTLESMSDAFFSIDKNWKISRVNGNLAPVTGLTPEQTLGKDPRDLWFAAPEHKQTQYWTQYHKVMNERVPVSFVEYYKPLNLWTQVRAFPKSDGGMAVFFSDIGEIKRAEEALAAERQKVEAQLKDDKVRLMRILENSPGATAMLSVKDWVFTYTNTKYREIFLGGADRVGYKVTDVLPESVDQGFIDLLENVYKIGEPFKGTEVAYALPQANGQIKTLYLNFVYEPVRDVDGNVESVLAAAYDVTELVESKKQLEASERQYRIAKEEAENANLSKSAFLANMSHEIRTPMTAVLGFAEILRDPNLTESEKQDALSRIDRSGRSLLKLIDDILDISKVESGKLAFERIRFSPVEVVNEVVSLLKLQADQKGISIKTKFSSQVPQGVCSDPARVRQILTNLVGNAVKFTSKGEVIIEVDVEKTLNPKRDFLIIKVSDTGIGISEQDHSKLFQPFAQADETISRQFGGTGLGLVLSKRLAEQLGGDLVLSSSKIAEGSLFTVKIEAGPFEKLTQVEEGPKARAESEVKAPIKNHTLQASKILVVDDVQDNQFLMRRYLESAGASVDIASDGEEAVKKALALNYDVVIMDIQMPIVDGIQATKELRSKGFRKPILALTAHAMKSEIERSIDAGCNEHLTKPISKRALVEAVSRFV